LSRNEILAELQSHRKAGIGLSPGTQAPSPASKPLVADDALPGMEADQRVLTAYEEIWIGDYIFENEWQSFRTKRDRSIELTSVFHECGKGRRKIAVKVVDIFGNDTMTIIDVNV